MSGTRRDPTARLAWNDYAAEALVQLLRERGLDVPRDVSVAGFDETAAEEPGGAGDECLHGRAMLPFRA